MAFSKLLPGTSADTTPQTNVPAQMVNTQLVTSCKRTPPFLVCGKADDDDGGGDDHQQ